MRVRKTIKAKILELSKGKEELLKCEYEDWQHTEIRSAPLYSASLSSRLIGF